MRSPPAMTSMDDDSLPDQFKVPVHTPIRGMDTVVASVTGYSGSERFSLIKLIDRSGAHFVGNMSRSITHLVCWKFEGKKFELAKKFNTTVVNHRWIEECIKNGRRVSEDAFTDKCGEEVGPLLLDISHFADEEINRCSQKDSTQQIIDLDSEDSALTHRTDPTSLNKIMNEEPDLALLPIRKMRSHALGKSPCRSRTLVKNNGNRKSSVLNLVRDKKYNHLQSVDEPSDDTASDYPRDSDPLPRPKKRSLVLVEPSRRSRRLVKKNASMGNSVFCVVPEQERNEEVDNYEHWDDTATSSSDARKHDSELGVGHAIEVCEKIQALIDANDQTPALTNRLFSTRNLQEDCSSLDGSSMHTSRSTKSPEISCVICLSGFNSTRGLLSCGHRFCFKCICNWAKARPEKRKFPTCPLCKANFEKIRKYTHTADNSDQDVYTQTMPPEHFGIDVRVYPDDLMDVLSGNYLDNQTSFSANPLAGPVCCRCMHHEFEDLLERCDVCQNISVHRFCLDPPLFPWTCDGCKDLQMLRRHPLFC